MSSGTIISTNKAHNSSSTYTLTASRTFTLALKYMVSSENNWDWLTIMHNSTQVVRTSGNGSYQNLTLNLQTGDRVTFTYSKDSSSNYYEDCIKIQLVTPEIAPQQEITVTPEVLENLVVTCTEDIKCSVCGETIKARLGHDITTHAAQNPTCNSEGWNAYEECSRCEYTTYQEIIRTNHNFVDGECTVCYTHEFSSGLEFELSADSTYYIVVGIGTVTDSHVYIPDKYNGKLVKEIKESAFEGKAFTTITIPNTIKVIGNYAFYGSKLVEMEIPNSVEVIGDAAFYGCTNLATVTIGNSVESIGKDTFSSCIKLNSIVLGKNVQRIGDGAFYNCKIVEATIPTYVIPAMQKSDLETLIIDGGDTISAAALKNCTTLKNIIIKETVTTIGAEAFMGCTNL